MTWERAYLAMVIVALILLPFLLYTGRSVGAFIWSFNLCIYLWLYKHHVERRG